MAVRLEEFWVNGQSSHQAFGIAEKMRRAIELRAKPFMGIKNQRVGQRDSFPQMAKLRADHRGPGPCRVDVNIEFVSSRNFTDSCDIVSSAHAGTSDTGDNARG